MSPRSLDRVIAVLRGAELQSADRKAAIRRAVEVSMLGAAALAAQGQADASAGGEQGDEVSTVSLEEVLWEIARHMGQPRVSVTDAKAFLRGLGDQGA